MGWDLGIDELLFPDPQARWFRGRMAPTAAICILLLGAALVLASRRRTAWISHLLAFTAGLISLVGIILYLYRVNTTSTLAFFWLMALPTALACGLISAGIFLATPDQGWMSVITSDTSGGAMARRLLPVCLAAPILLGRLVLWGLRSGRYDADISLTLLTVLAVTGSTILVCWNAISLHNADLRTRRSQDALRESEIRLVAAQQVARVGSWEVHLDTGRAHWSDETFRILGLPPGSREPSHELFLSRVHPSDREMVSQAIHHSQPGKTLRLDHRVLGAKDEVRVVHEEGEILFDESGKPSRIFATIQDVTERHKLESELENRLRQQAAVAMLGQRALACTSLQEFFDETVMAVAKTLELDFCQLLELLPDRDSLRLQAGVGWKPGLVGSATTGIRPESQAGHTLAAGAPVIVGDPLPENPFTEPGWLLEHGVTSGITVLVPGRTQPWGVLGAHARQPRVFSEDDVHFLQSVAGLLAATIERHMADAARSASESRFRRLLESNLLGVFVADSGGRVADANDAFLNLVGRSRLELRENRIHWDEITPPEYRSLDATAADEARRSGACQPYEKEFLRPDGTRVPVLIGGALVEGSQGQLVGWALDLRERKQAEQEVRDLSARLLQLQDEERRRIARELHDTTAQNLAGLQMNLTLLAEDESALGEKARRALSDSLELADECAREVRTLSYLLHPPLLDELGLISALRVYLEGYSKRTGVAVHFHADPEITRLPREVELTLFRIAQEALSNVHRHAQSPRVAIRIQTDPERRLILEISDQGRGMPPEMLDRLRRGVPLGVGVAGMRERVRQLGGGLEIHSGGVGTLVRVLLPRSAWDRDLTTTVASRAAS